MMVLVSRQSPLYNQDLNFQFGFKSNLGRPIPDKKMIHLLNLNELHEEHISHFTMPVYHPGLLTFPLPYPTRHLGVTSRGINGILKI